AGRGVAPQQAVVREAQTQICNRAIRKIRTPMRTVAVDQTVISRPVLVEDEVLAEEAHGLGGAIVQLGDGGDRHPVAPEELAHGRTGADFGQPLILRFAQHRSPAPPPPTVWLARFYSTQFIVG